MGAFVDCGKDDKKDGKDKAGDTNKGGDDKGDKKAGGGGDVTKAAVDGIDCDKACNKQFECHKKGGVKLDKDTQLKNGKMGCDMVKSMWKPGDDTQTMAAKAMIDYANGKCW